MTFEAGKYIKKEKQVGTVGQTTIPIETYSIEAADVKSSVPGVTAIVLVNGVVVKGFQTSTLISWQRNNNKVFVSFKSGPEMILILPNNGDAITTEERIKDINNGLVVA